MSYKAQLDDYFLHNYSIYCPPTPYLGTNEFMVTFVRILTPFSVLLSVYALIVIFLATSNSMKNAQWAILHVHLASCYVEFVCNILAEPYFHLPHPAVHVNGFLLDTGIPPRIGTVLCQLSFIFVGLALVTFAENRFSSIVTNPYRITKKSTRITYYVCSYVGCITLFSLYATDSFNSSFAKLEILQSLPCPEKSFFSERTVVFTMDRMRLAYIVSSLAVYITFSFCAFALYSAYLLLRKPNGSMSEKTRQLQTRFFFLFLFQISLPMLFMLFPLAVAFGISFIQKFNSTTIINSMVLITVCFHGVISSTSLVFVYKPYRKFTLQLLQGKCPVSVKIRVKESSTLAVNT